MWALALCQPYAAVQKELLELQGNQHMEIESEVEIMEGSMGEKLDFQ